MISVIIPAHNERENLEVLLPYLERIESDVPVEIIVAVSVDTTDGSEFVSISDSVSIFRCEGRSRALQMNTAFRKSSGSTLVFLHADVIPPASFYKDINATINKGYDAGFFSYRFNKEDFFLKINAKFTAKESIFTGGGDQCLFIKKEVFSNLGKFNEEQLLMEDYEFFDRMKKHKINYKIISNNLIVSGRKYQYNSYARVNLSNLILLILYKLGWSSSKLKALHSKLIRTPIQPNSQ